MILRFLKGRIIFFWCILPLGILTTYIILIHKFLAPVYRISTPDFLVVESWLNNKILHLALTEFRGGNYKKILIIESYPQASGKSSEMEIKNERAKNFFLQAGIPTNKIEKIIGYYNKVGSRTFASYYALRKWMINNNLLGSHFIIFNVSVHGRKSYRMCKRAFGKNFNPLHIGIISAPPFEYNAQKWWMSSRGIYLVLRNSLAYIMSFLPFYYGENE